MLEAGCVSCVLSDDGLDDKQRGVREYASGGLISIVLPLGVIQRGWLLSVRDGRSLHSLVYLLSLERTFARNSID